MATTDATEEEIREFLRTGEDGRPAVPEAIAEPLVEYLAELGMPLADVKGLGLEAYDQAWQMIHGKYMSYFYKGRLAAFLGVEWSPPDDAYELRDKAAEVESPPKAVVETPPPRSLVKPVTTTRKAFDPEEKLATGLTRLQTTALDTSIHVGTLVTEEEVEGETFGGDAATTTIAKAQRKASTGYTLPELVAKSDADGVMEMLTNLTRDYNNRGMTTEVTLLTAARTDMDEIFSTDQKSKLQYLMRYRKKYRGLGFPAWACLTPRRNFSSPRHAPSSC